MAGKGANTVGFVWTQVFAHLIRLQRGLCELLVVAMIVLVSGEVVCRSLFGFSLQITHEVAGYLLVSVTFLGIGVSLHDRALFRVEFLFSRLTPRGQCGLQVLFTMLALVFSVILDHQLIRLVASSYVRGVREATILGTPLYLPQLVMPIGVSLMIIVLVADLWADARTLLGGTTRPEGQTSRR